LDWRQQIGLLLLRTHLFDDCDRYDIMLKEKQMKPSIFHKCFGHWWAYCIAYTNPLWKDTLRQRGQQFKHIVLPACLYLARGAILDIGTGTGRLPVLLATMAPQVISIGVDPNDTLLRDAYQTACKYRCDDRVSFVKACAQELPFATGSFDMVISVASIHQWDERKKCIIELYRVLKDRGIGLILVGSGLMWLFDLVKRNLANDRDLNALFQAVGFKDVKITHPKRELLQITGRK
jgi:ubiquinone/menaquinone biosynthesis C-methylase UbiE